MRPDRIGSRALGRATLARQLLLERSGMAPRDAVAHLVGMQAQVPLHPYVGLWSRLRGFRPEALGRLLMERELVRIVVMRGTIHLLTAEDCLELRPPVQPILDRELANHQEHKEALRGLDPAPVVAAAKPFLAEPRTIPEIRSEMEARFPEHPPAALAYLCRNHLPLVQVPPRGVWGRTLQVTLVDAEAWLGRPLSARPDLEAICRRYLGAFGPASPADVARWSGLPAMRAVLEGMRGALRPFADERGRELLDLPDAPRPDPDCPAPPRFLPEYDNVLLGHADRSRFASEEDRRRIGASPGPHKGSVLLDGALLGTWAIARGEGSATLSVRHLRPVQARERERLAAEGRRLLRLTDPSAESPEVAMAPLA